MSPWPRAAAVSRPVASPRLVARDREVEALRRALGEAANGHGGTVFVTGEAGIGKSRLVRFLADEAGHRENPVLTGRAVQSTTPVPYRPMSEALSAAARTGAAPDHPALLPFRDALTRLVPGWGRADEATGTVVALAEAGLRLLSLVGGDAACVLVLEDLQWSDAETLEMLEYVSDNLANSRILCLPTFRDDEPSQVGRLAQRLRARGAADLVRLAPLHPPEVAEMAGLCLGAAAAFDDIAGFADRAGGVPLLVEELLAAAVTTGALVRDGDRWRAGRDAAAVVPAGLVGAVRQRLDALARDVREVVADAAVLGRSFDWRLLPATTGRPEEAVLAALRTAVAAHLIEPDGDGFRFRHALTRDAVAADLLPPERVARSHRALTAIDDAHPGLEGEWCELAAHLAEAAGERERAARLAWEAGRRALARGALTTADAALERARDLLTEDSPVHDDVDETRCHVLALAGRWEPAHAIARRLLPRWANDAHVVRRAQLRLRLARAALAANHWDEAHELVEAVRADGQDVGAEVRARALALAAGVALHSDPGNAADLATSALDAATDLGLPEVRCEALEVIGRSVRPHDLAGAEDAFVQAHDVAEAHSLSVWRVRALNELGTLDMLRGHGVARLETARDLALGQGSLATAATVDVQIAAALAMSDEPDTGLAASQRCIAQSRRHGWAQTLAAALALQAHIHARAGREAEMRRCVEEAESCAPDRRDVMVKAALALAVHGLRNEDRAAALAQLDEGVRQVTSGPGGDYTASPVTGLDALLRAVTGGAHRSGVRTDGGYVHFMARAFHDYARAVEAGRAADPERAAALVTDADSTLGGHNWLRQLGRRLVAEAALADGWGQPVAWLREALDFFDAHGEDTLASACRSLLRRAGVAVPRQRGTERVPPPLRALGLTAREVEVLRLLATGLGNREIAARLHLSPRTVERHIANLADKTGVTGRTPLVAYAARSLTT